ncbi:uncharacterized protein EI97DRAFT_52301 [Westerdykella ornata]|uniref:HTH La-type RNA-binding domain-containing protein n=1 Tax=Westerdykella ornata TaxID=318751 RepID=A0A6A6JIZ0_WESOR|nr:uncharacterized protein EI97DRAFT_52301 [Westerdykella ornata]KAF2276204.1 hypothetical protein EI97DRAFT_52301 [Westerdykella ornata]
MTASTNRTGADGASAPVPFSYAQAAKGLSNNATSNPAKQPSGTSTPAKDDATNSTAIPLASVPSWADDAEQLESRDEKRDTRPQKVQVPSKQGPQDTAATFAVTSPSSGAPSSITAKDDDVSSVQNASSESTSNWENKSQASTSVDKISESGKSSEKAKAKSSEKGPIKPLQEAPVPAVNPWARRADELKAKAAQKIAAPKVNTSVAPASANAAQSPLSPTKKAAKGISHSEGQDAKEKGVSGDFRPKGRDDERASSGRKESKAELDSDKARKGYKSRPADKEPRAAASVLPLPPDRDQESWPTPDIAVDEERRKAQSKSDKTDVERKEPSSSRPHGKQEWVPVPYTPTVVFNTPLPSTMSSRRGGRGGGRGGSQANGRNGNMPGSSGSVEKDASAPQTNGDVGKRGRSDVSSGRDSFAKEARAVSVGSSGVNESRSTVQGEEKPGKTMSGTEADGRRRVSVPAEAGSGSQSASQNNTFPRQYGQRPNKGRRGDVTHQGEKRKEGEGTGQGRDASHDRRTSTANHAELADEGERRSSHPHAAQNGQSRLASNERRQYGSFSGRDRARGAGRGPRGAPFQNPAGHQFANGHANNMHGSSTFAMRSPTTFHPDQNAYFSAGSQQNRSYRGGHRSQSVAGDGIYGRAPAYPAGAQQIPPIQTFMSGVYDYQMMSPMSAVPYSPYGYDSLITLVTTQVEYYFSVDNLCKDMFLRKHMDSQGYVFLSVIADFNRVKQLTTDMELLKFVCYNAPSIDFRVGVDGRERVRRREGWQQWVLSMSERDPSAQNDGSELQSPPVLHMNGFDPAPYPGYSTSSTVANGFPAGNNPETRLQQADSTQNGALDGQAPNGINGFVGVNGHYEMSTKAVSGDPDSFPDAQVETLSVIAHIRGQPQVPDPPLSASGTRSNGSFDSNNDLQDGLEETRHQQFALKVDGVSTERG